MNRAVLVIFFFAGDCLAHPGHGAPLVHYHDWNSALLICAIAVVVAAIAFWRAK